MIFFIRMQMQLPQHAPKVLSAHWQAKMQHVASRLFGCNLELSEDGQLKNKTLQNSVLQGLYLGRESNPHDIAITGF